MNAHVLDLLAEVVGARPHVVGVLLHHLWRQRLAGHDPEPAGMHLQRAHGRDDYGGIWRQPGGPALDVEESLGAHVGRKAGLGDEKFTAGMPMRSAITDELPVAMLPNGPACTSTGVLSSVCKRLGLMASRRMTVMAPAAKMSSAVIGLPLVVLPITIRPRRRRMSCNEVVSASTVITSEAAVMSKPVARITPSSRVPRPTMTLRRTRSLTSSTRRQVTLSRSTSAS